MDKKIKVMVIDDSAFYRQTIINMLEKSPTLEVIGTAGNGTDAIRFLARNKPDVITLDLEMPGIDGITFFRWLMKNNPIPTLIISSIAGGQNALKALDMGAVDFIEKPTRNASMRILEIEKELFEKIAIISDIPVERLMIRSMLTSSSATETAHEQERLPEPFNCLIAIGSSTGGPSAVQKVLMDLPENFPCPIVISQHMPEVFTTKFADRLNSVCNVRVKEAEVGDILKPGWAYVCPGGKHMEFYKDNEDTNKTAIISLLGSNSQDRYTPSVDLMMKSAVNIYGNKVVGVILTGMGNDGLEGMRAIKEKEGQTIAESKDTALVYGMPKEVLEHGYADKSLPLQFIGREIIRHVMGSDARDNISKKLSNYF